jgi:glycosyltransferase involved in cell wall biosynthesis
MGHAVGIVCDSETGNERDADRLQALGEDLKLGVRHIAMDRMVGIADAKAAIAAAEAIVSTRPDVVHGHGAKGGAYGRLGATLARRKGVRPKRFYTAHGGSLHYDPATMAGRFYFTAERWLERASDGIIFVSRFEQEAYQAKVGAPGCATRQVYNGLAPEEFEPAVLDSQAADILFMGELRHLKGVDVLIDAIALLQKRRPTTAAIIGAGPDRDVFVERVQQHGLQDRVIFHGAMPARAAFALGRIMVVPSRAEALPYVVLEAVAAAKPIVASGVGGIPEILPANQLVPPDDAQALAAALIGLLEAPAEARRAALIHAQEIRPRFSTQAMAASITSFYGEAA